MGNNRFLLIKAKGGMGNRMLCAITGLLYARATDRTPVVDWSDGTYSNDGSNAFSGYFETTTAQLSALPVDTNYVPALWKGTTEKPLSYLIQTNDPTKHSSPLIHRKYSIDCRRLDYTEQVAVFWYYTHRLNQLLPALRNTPLDSYTQLGVRGSIRELLSRDMKLVPEIRMKVDEFKARHWKAPMIGLHIRCTDLKTDLGAYRKALDRLLTQVPDATLFLATDNAQVMEDYIARYPRVVSTPKWLPAGVHSLHQNAACPDRFANGVEALLDMYLLAECDYLIYPGSSTFSWIAGIMAGLDEAHLIDVERHHLIRKAKRWFRDLLP